MVATRNELSRLPPLDFMVLLLHSLLGGCEFTKPQSRPAFLLSLSQPSLDDPATHMAKTPCIIGEVLVVQGDRGSA